MHILRSMTKIWWCIYTPISYDALKTPPLSSFSQSAPSLSLFLLLFLSSTPSPMGPSRPATACSCLPLVPPPRSQAPTWWLPFQKQPNNNNKSGSNHGHKGRSQSMERGWGVYGGGQPHHSARSHTGAPPSWDIISASTELFAPPGLCHVDSLLESSSECCVWFIDGYCVVNLVTGLWFEWLCCWDIDWG